MGALIFSYIRRLVLFFFFLGGGQNLNFYIFGVFQKIECEDFVDVFGGHHKIRRYLGVISMHFRVFS